MYADRRPSLAKQQSRYWSEDAGAAETPARAIKRIEQPQPVLAGVGHDQLEMLAGAGGGGRSGLRQLLGGSTAKCCLGQIGRCGREPLAVGDDVVIHRFALFDVGVEFDPAKARFVKPGGLLAVALPEGSGRKAIAAQAGGPFFCAAAFAARAVSPSKTPTAIPIPILMLSSLLAE